MALQLSIDEVAGFIAVAVIGMVIYKLCSRKHPERAIHPAVKPLEDSWTGFKTLLKTGDMNALHTGEQEAIDPRLQAHYDQYIRPHTKRFEDERVASLTKLRTRIRMAIRLTILTIVLAVISKPAVQLAFVDYIPVWVFFLLNAIGMLSLPLAIVVAIYAIVPVFHHKRSIRHIIFHELLRFFGPDWRYVPDGILSEHNPEPNPMFARPNEAHNAHLPNRDYLKMVNLLGIGTPMSASVAAKYQSFGIIPKTDNAYTRDVLIGEYKGVAITLVQCTLSNSDSGSDGGSDD